MQEGFHLAQGEQGRLVCRGFGEVHHQTDMGTAVAPLVVYPLSFELRHPSPSLLALARIEVRIEHRKKTSVFVIDFVGLYVGVIHRYFCIGLETDTIEFGGQPKHTLDDI